MPTTPTKDPRQKAINALDLVVKGALGPDETELAEQICECLAEYAVREAYDLIMGELRVKGVI